MTAAMNNLNFSDFFLNFAILYSTLANSSKILKLRIDNLRIRQVNKGVVNFVLVDVVQSLKLLYTERIYKSEAEQSPSSVAPIKQNYPILSSVHAPKSKQEICCHPVHILLTWNSQFPFSDCGYDILKRQDIIGILKIQSTEQIFLPQPSQKIFSYFQPITFYLSVSSSV